eukprot:TRINITY_DN5810_c0_g1_i1.p1 TRINITY_DN5810_c0_g1~~TRINITY_DN5810_c0_g1_i1.p1  ORF type:complete len:684 (+),score=200.69 TRINITY_DN5810_c0_g1_i1:29-2080(+)
MNIPDHNARDSGHRGTQHTKTNIVQNRAPSNVQITAEQILRESRGYQDVQSSTPRSKVTDGDELKEFRTQKRTEFEERLRRDRMKIKEWLRYGKFEADQGDYERARSVYNRALDLHPRVVTIWQAYAEFEESARMINHARNVWDRAVTLLPREDRLWHKAIFLEQSVGQYGAARQLFERWMAFGPAKTSWHSYINFEIKLKEWDLVRGIYKRYIECHPCVESYLKFAKFEDGRNEVARARKVYMDCSIELGEAAETEDYFTTFARFEEKHHEFDRARGIYTYGLDHIPKHQAPDLYAAFVTFEKMHGDGSGIDTVIAHKKRFQYQEEVRADPHNYDAWFEYLRLEMSEGDVPRIRSVFEDAVSNIPLIEEKNYWRRYIYIWIFYAIFEELDAQDVVRAREVWRTLLNDVIPHKVFSSSKSWIHYAHFEVRQHNIEAARKIFGRALGMAPKDKIFEAYIQLELQLTNVDRCRKLYEKFLQFAPENVNTWTKFAELEDTLGEETRARAIYDLAISQEKLDAPEMLWKNYIDWEVKNNELDRVRVLYSRLLELTMHVKVWISFATFEASNKETERARALFEKADAHFKSQNEDGKDARVVLIEAWVEFENQNGTEEQIKVVTDKVPTKLKKRRALRDEVTGEEKGWEEYYDYTFPDQEDGAKGIKILQLAQAWKKRRTEKGEEKTA